MSEKQARDVFERLKAILYSGEHPFVRVEKFNVTAAIESDDRPAAFVMSFIGSDINTDESPVAVHVQLDPTMLARFMEQVVAAGIAEFHYAISGERTHVMRSGEVEFLPKEGTDD